MGLRNERGSLITKEELMDGYQFQGGEIVRELHTGKIGIRWLQVSLARLRTPYGSIRLVPEGNKDVVGYNLAWSRDSFITKACNVYRPKSPGDRIIKADKRAEVVILDDPKTETKSMKGASNMNTFRVCIINEKINKQTGAATMTFVVEPYDVIGRDSEKVVLQAALKHAAEVKKEGNFIAISAAKAWSLKSV